MTIDDDESPILGKYARVVRNAKRTGTVVITDRRSNSKVADCEITWTNTTRLY